MKIDIQINITDAGPDEVARVLSIAAAQGSSDAVKTPLPPRRQKTAETTTAGAEITEGTTAMADAAETLQAEDVVVGETNEEELVELDRAPNAEELTATLVEQRKPTKTTTVEGHAVPMGDLVAFEGSPWAVHAAFRGYVVLENEAGDAIVAAPKDLALIPKEDAQPEEQTAQPGGDPVPETDADYTVADVKNLYVEVSKQISNAKATDLMRGIAGGARLTELDAAQLAAAATALSAELDAFNG